MAKDKKMIELNTACKICGSKLTYLRLKNMTRVCRNCGANFKVEIKEVNKK